MKLSRVFYVIGAVFIVIIMVVSVLFVYNTAYGTLRNISFRENGLSYNNSDISLNFTVSGVNKGFMSQQIIIGNTSINFPPGNNVSNTVPFSISMNALNKSGWPKNNATISESLPIKLPGYIFTITTELQHNFTIGAPVYGFDVTSVKSVGSDKYNISVAFTYFTQVNIPSGQIIIYNQTSPIGNISFSSLSTGNSYDLSGSFFMKNAPTTTELYFRLGPIEWSEKNVGT